MPEAPSAAPPAAPAAPTPSNAEASASIANAARSAGALGVPSSSSGTAGKGMQDAFAALRKKAGIEEPVKPADKPAAKAEPKVEQKVTEPKKDDAGTDDADVKTDIKTDVKPAEQPKPKKPADFLREEKDKWKTKAEQLEQEVAKYKTPQDDPEKKTLSETLEKERVRLKSLEDEIRFANYERSQEYKDKWEKPFIDAYQSGRSKIKALKVTDQATGETRPGSESDFDAIMQQPSDEAAVEMIEALFGSGSRAQIVTLAREKVLEHNLNRENALKEFQTKGSEREKQLHETTAKLQKEVGTLWADTIKPEHVPDQWKPYILPKGVDGEGKPIDEEGDAALERGYKFFDSATAEDARNPALTPEQRKEVLARAASVRHRAAAFGRLTKWVKQRDDKISSLEKELEQYRKTEPGPGEGAPEQSNGSARPGTMADALARLHKAASTGRPVFH